MDYKIKGVKRYFEPKAGKYYCYHRKSGIRLFAEPGTEDFFNELKEAENSIKKPLKPKAGTLALLMIEYKKSHYFETLKPRTQRDYHKVMDYLKSIEKLPLKGIKPSTIVKIRDKAYEQKKRSFANYVIAVLSILFEFAKERDYMETNPAKGVRKIRRPKDAPKINRPWSKAERDVISKVLPLHILVPVAISRWTGFRQGDVLKIPKTAYDGHNINYRTSKAGVTVIIPVAQPLKIILDHWLSHINSTHSHECFTICVNSRGMPWTGAGFRASFFTIINKLTDEGKIGSGITFHGLRHTVATDLRELGYDKRTIADVLGQKTEEMAEIYCAGADLSDKMKGVIQKLEKRT